MENEPDKLSPDEFASIAVIVAEMEAKIERLTAENDALRVQVADLEYTIGWRAKNGVTSIFGREGGES